MSAVPNDPGAGWRTDPDDGTGLRWWDGAAWTDARAPAPPSPPAAGATSDEQADSVAAPFDASTVVHRTIPVPLDVVWDQVSDVAGWSTWTVLTDVSLGGPLAMGTPIRAGISLLNQTVELTGMLAEIRPRVRLSARFAPAHGLKAESVTWLAVAPVDGGTQVEYGIGYRGGGRITAMLLRGAGMAETKLMRDALDRLAKQLETSPRSAPSLTLTASSTARPSTALKAARLATDVAGLSSDPGTRHLSRTARRWIDKQIARQTPSTVHELPMEVRRAAELVAAINRSANDSPTRHLMDLYQRFVETLGLRGRAADFAAGALHLGYAVRRTEERLTTTAPLPVPGLAKATKVPGGVYTTAAACANRRGPVDILAAPGVSPDEREILLDFALAMLTNPGSEFSSRPAGITEEQIALCERFGFALRCCEVAAAS